MSSVVLDLELLQPHASDLKKTKNVEILQQGITDYLHSVRHPDACERAGRIYLAVALSLCQAQLVDDPSSCPDLTVGNGHSSFRVTLSNWAEGLTLEHKQAILAGHSLQQSTTGTTSNKDVDLELFVAIQRRLSEESVHGHKRRRYSNSLASAQQAVSRDVSTEPPSDSNNPSHGLAAALLGVAETESVVRKLTHRVNRAYFELGKAYVAFGRCTFSSCPPADSAAFHTLVFGSAIVALRATVGDGMARDSPEAGLKKKLERARKYWIVVECFGERALELVDLLCVTRLDKVSFARLRQIAQTISALHGKSLRAESESWERDVSDHEGQMQ
ncbi:unnamed protein product [Jaminaea pallidilutea]